MRIRSAIVLALAIPVRLVAQEPAGNQRPPDWSVNVGAMAFAFPSYPGSDEYRVVPFPLADVRFRDRVYLGPSSTGIGFALGPTHPELALETRRRARRTGQPPGGPRGCTRGHGGPRPGRAPRA